MAEAVERFMDKGETNVVEETVDSINNYKTKKLAAAMCENEEQVRTELEKLRDEEDYENAKKENELTKKLEAKTGKKIIDDKKDSGSGL